MKTAQYKLAGIILMGPFGSGKSYLGRALRERGVARYTELEPIIYERFANEDDLDIEKATAFIRAHYVDTITDGLGLAAFESTGVVQRPLLLELLARFHIGLIRVNTPKEICLQRVTQRNVTSARPIDMSNAAEFYRYWHEEIAPTYNFSLTVDGLNVEDAIEAILQLLSVEP